MYEETKVAVKKAFDIGKILFTMDLDKYNELLTITSKINSPTLQELNIHIANDLSLEDAIIEVLKEKYISVAIGHGFTDRQGLAMLEYAAMLEELDEEI